MLQDAKQCSEKLTVEIDFLTATIKDIQELVSNGTITSVQLVQAYLNRIEANNRNGLKLRAVMETAQNTDLLAIAQTCDDMRNKGVSKLEYGTGAHILISE